MCVGVVSFQLVTSFAMGRTKANMKPPAAVPHITGADTQSQLSVALGAPFHSCSRSTHHPRHPSLWRARRPGRASSEPHLERMYDDAIPVGSLTSSVTDDHGSFLRVSRFEVFAVCLCGIA